MELIEHVFDRIAKYLCYIDLFRFLKANPRALGFIRRKRFDVQAIVEKRLKILGPIGKSILDDMIEYQNVISGSFILQCLYNEDWESDIDIYCLDDSRQLDPDYISPNSFAWHLYINEFANIKQSSNYEFLHVWSRKYESGNFQKVINHIIIKKESLEIMDDHNIKNKTPKNYSSIFHFVDESFDLEICKVVFDGKKLYIKNLDSLIYKKCKVSLNLDKYIRRGFWPEGLISDKILEDFVRARIEKYKARGFNIEISE